MSAPKFAVGEWVSVKRAYYHRAITRTRVTAIELPPDATRYGPCLTCGGYETQYRVADSSRPGLFSECLLRPIPPDEPAETEFAEELRRQLEQRVGA